MYTRQELTIVRWTENIFIIIIPSFDDFFNARLANGLMRECILGRRLIAGSCGYSTQIGELLQILATMRLIMTRYHIP